jgi:hypothetical protein
VVFVLDDTASMAAGDTVARASAAVRERLAALGGADRTTLLCTGARPVVLVGPRAVAAEAGPALASWRPRQPRHDPTPALDLARELAGGGGCVVFVGDEAPPAGAEDVTTLAFGAAGANAALLAVQRRSARGGDGDHDEIAVRVLGCGGIAGTELRCLAGDVELARLPIAFAAGLADVVLTVPRAAANLRLQLAADGLGLDDAAWLLPAPPRTVAVADLVPPELRDALLLPRVLTALPDLRAERDPLAAQLVLTTQPGTLAAGQTEVVFAPPPAGAERSAWRGPFVVDRAHPWLQGVQLDGVVWLAGGASLPGRVLVAVGERALATEEALEHGRRLWLDVDPAAGNLMRAPDWPLLFANVLDGCREEVPGAVSTAVAVGGELRYRRRPGHGGEALVLRTPDGRSVPGRAGRTVGWVVDEPGVHEVRGAGDEVLARVAARFVDAAESDLSSRRSGEFAPVAAAVATRAAPVQDTSFERRLVLLLVLVALLSDWWWLARRRG